MGPKIRRIKEIWKNCGKVYPFKLFDGFPQDPAFVYEATMIAALSPVIKKEPPVLPLEKRHMENSIFGNWKGVFEDWQPRKTPDRKFYEGLGAYLVYRAWLIFKSATLKAYGENDNLV